MEGDADDAISNSSSGEGGVPNINTLFISQPSVREMSLLLEQNGQLQSKIEALRKEKAELLDKTIALGILVQL